MRVQVYYTDKLNGSILPPSSKNYTTRYILVSSLADGISEIKYPATSDDADAALSCCKALGADICQKDENTITVKGFGRNPKNPGVINPGNAGAVLRFLIGTASLLPKITFKTDYTESLGKRPNQDLLDALSQLGVRYESNNGKLPITLYGGNLSGGDVSISGATSSQFVTALLFLAPLINKDIRIKVINDLKSKPLIRTTLEVMRDAGIHVTASDDLMQFEIKAGQEYRARTWNVNGDWPGSMALISAAAVAESDVVIDRLYEDQQGEREGINVLRAMGVNIVHQDNRIHIKSSGKLAGNKEFDGDLFTDAVLPLLAAAALAEGKTRFYNVENLRYKECDRITEPLAELRKAGVECYEKKDEIIIVGNPDGYEGGVEVDGRGDHRVIMMLAILGIRCRKGLMITGAQHVSKSFPHFFSTIEKIGAKFTILD